MRAEELEDLIRQEERHWWFRGRRRILGAVLAGLGAERPAACVVDLGCGAAYELEALAPASARCVGIDRSGAALRAARARLGGSGSGGGSGAGPPARFLFSRADAGKVPLRGGCAGLVLALDVLEHLEQDAEALAEARRILEPGGLLLATVPAWPALWSEHDVALEHRRRYQRRELGARVEAAGFRIERQTYFNTLLFVPAVIYRLAHRWARGLPEAAGAGPGAGRGSGAARVPVSDTRRLGNGCGALLGRILAAERLWIGRGLRLPFGLSLLVAARRL